MTYEDLRTNIRDNLDDNGVKFYDAADITQAIEEAESDIAFLARHIIKKVDLPFRARPYYDFKFFGVLDYLTTIAIFNNNTNRWLRDDLTHRDFDRIRDDWELWTGTPQYWAPVNLDIIAIVPYMPEPSGNLTLYYASIPDEAPADSDTPLIATSFQKLIENYATAALLEQQEEFTKAGDYFEQYYADVVEYSDRVKNQARRDLLLKI